MMLDCLADLICLNYEYFNDNFLDVNRIYRTLHDTVNYKKDEDKNYKEYLKKLKLKLFCVRENHEERPENIFTYKEVEMFDGKVFIEEEYTNLIFAKDGENYDTNGKRF